MADDWRVVGTLALLALACEGATAIAFTFWPNPPEPAMDLGSAYCQASALAVACTFTNPLRTKAAGQCVRVALVPKKAGKEVVSPALCSGAVPPRETKTVTLPLGWRAVDACADAHGGLSFESCDVRIDGVP